MNIFIHKDIVSKGKILEIGLWAKSMGTFNFGKYAKLSSGGHTNPHSQ